MGGRRGSQQTGQWRTSRSSMVKTGAATPTFLLFRTPPSSFSLSCRFPIVSTIPSIGRRRAQPPDRRRRGFSLLGRKRAASLGLVMLSPWRQPPYLFSLLSGAVGGSQKRKETRDRSDAGVVGGSRKEKETRATAQIEDAHTLLRARLYAHNTC